MKFKQNLERTFWNLNLCRALSYNKTFEITSRSTSYFFVDTAVILGYRLDQYAGINAFIENPTNKFFYTESVLEELRELKYLRKIPEADPKNPENTFFKFVDSRLKTNHKQSAVDLLQNLWLCRFAEQLKNPRLGFQLNPQQLESFKRDLFIIFESGYACHAPGVLPDDHLLTPPLLTNNMQLIKKFTTRPEVQKTLENTINLCGMEHLMQIVYLEDAIERQQVELKNNSLVHESSVSKLT